MSDLLSESSIRHLVFLLVNCVLAPDACGSRALLVARRGAGPESGPRHARGPHGQLACPAIFGEYWSAASASPPDYSGITVPVLAIYASEDERYMLPADASAELVAAQRSYEQGPLATWRETSIAQVRQAVPSAQIIEMKAGHHMFLHRRDETLAHIREFLRKLASSDR